MLDSLKDLASGSLHSLKVLIDPKNSIESLLKAGDVITRIKAFRIAVDRVKQDPAAKQLIEERYSPGMPPLEKLAEYPKNSLGYLFYDQITSANLQMYPYHDMSDYTEGEYLKERRREIHDILHVVLKYDTGLIGEASLNTFLASTSGMPVTVLIPLGVTLKFLFTQPEELEPLLDSLGSAWNRGKDAVSPFGIKWEEHFKTNIEEVRTMLEPSLIISI